MMHGIAEATAAGLALTRSQSRSVQPSARRIRVAGKRTVLAATSEASAAYRVDRTTITALTEDNVREAYWISHDLLGLAQTCPRDRLAIGDEI